MSALEELDTIIAAKRAELAELEQARETIARLGVFRKASTTLAVPSTPSPPSPRKQPPSPRKRPNSKSSAPGEARQRELVAEALKLGRGGVPKVARREGINENTFWTWVRKYREPETPEGESKADQGRPEGGDRSSSSQEEGGEVTYPIRVIIDEERPVEPHRRFDCDRLTECLDRCAAPETRWDRSVNAGWACPDPCPGYR